MSPQTVKEILASDAHFFEKCDAVTKYQKIWCLSERFAATKLGISKSEIHRMNKVASVPGYLREAIIKHKTAYYAVYFMKSAPGHLVNDIRNGIISGSIKTFKQARDFISTQKDPKKLERKNEFERIQKKYNQDKG